MAAKSREASRAVDQAQPKHPSLRRLSVVFAFVLLAVVALVCVTLARLGALPVEVLAAAILIDLVVTVAIIVGLIRTGWFGHRWSFWLTAALATVLLVANLGVGKVTYDLWRFGDSIQPPSDETITYDIIVPTAGPTKLAELAGQSVGLAADDDQADNVTQTLTAKVAVNIAQQDNWQAVVQSVSDGSTTAGIIQDAQWQLLAELSPEQYGGLRLLDQFEVTVEPTADSTSSPTPSASTTSAIPPTDAFVVYISGIDIPGNISNRSRSDVNILMVINPTTGKVLLVNTPRDYYVQLAGTTGLKDKLTHAGIYGIEKSVDTLDALYGININYYLRINFSSLLAVVDALGGVDVDSAYDFTSGGFHFVLGQNHLDGEQALAFSRARYNFAEGDRVRGENQERVIEGLIHKLTDPSILANYASILAAVQTSIQTSMPQDEMFSLVRNQLASGQQWTVSRTAVTGSDASDYTYSWPSQKLYVMIPDQASLDAAKAEISSVLSGQ
ncbi:MAG: LCP family protein [Propionibacteriaceae bacterium]|jgi:LCP family protein required for cell wall assembly|nr:LCP family protein [Propionibacteriaceae bacterium]